MKNILHFMREIHSYAGSKLYVNFIGMIIMSLFESVGIFMLIPLIGLTGMIEFQLEENSPLSMFYGWFQQFPDSYSLIFILMIYVLLMSGQALFQRFQLILNGKIQQGFIRHLRDETYKSLVEADWAFYLRKRKSDIINLMTTELGRVSGGTNLLLQFIASALFTCIQIGVAFWLSAQMTISVLVFGAAMLWFSKTFIKKSTNLGNETVELSRSFLAGLSDHFNGIKDIKSNMLEESHIAWVQSKSKQMEDNILSLVKVRTTSQFLHRVVSSLLIAAFVFFAIRLFHAQTAQLMLILVIFSRLWPRMSAIQSNLENLGTLLPSFNAVVRMKEESLASKEQRYSGSRTPPAMEMKDAIELKDVCFQYEANTSYALQNIHVMIPVNQMTAVVGPSGAGKSTLIDVIIGLNRPCSGEIWIDGNRATDDSLLSLRQSMGYVSQDPFLFNGSIKENLLLVNPKATEEQLWEALEFSASAEFVRNLPEGINTVIGDRGVKLSGGERQRIVLARAILKKPSILILDEATSALDSENETKIQTALENLKGRMTIIVIAHRMSTIRNADQVIVMDKGRVAQIGAFPQLAADSKGLFHKLLGNQVKVAL